ncbi:polysaccharide biosynthesis protein, partial [Micromonospora sp. NPDC005313]
MDRDAITPVQPSGRITHRAATSSLLTLDTAAWCGGFLGAAWTRYEFDLTAAVSLRTLGLALACAALYAVLTLLRFRIYGRYPIGSAGDAQGLAVTVALVAAA